jgi:hypothetical protein
VWSSRFGFGFVSNNKEGLCSTPPVFICVFCMPVVVAMSCCDDDDDDRQCGMEGGGRRRRRRGWKTSRGLQ